MSHVKKDEGDSVMVRISEDPASSKWHLDRRIPIALMLSVMLQTGAAIWWAGRMDYRMTNGEQRIQEIVARNTRVDALLSTQGSDLAVVVSQLRSVTESLERLQGQVEATNEMLRDVFRANGGVNGNGYGGRPSVTDRLRP